MKTIAAKAARELKKELRKEFPGVKFSVTSENYSGGNSVNVSYVDGPTRDKVKTVADKYQMGTFDGMVDMYRRDNVRDDIPQVRHVFVEREMSEETKGKLEKEVREKFDVHDKGLYDYFVLDNGMDGTVFGEMSKVFEEQDKLDG